MGIEMFLKRGQALNIAPTSYISPSVLTFRNEKDKQNQGLMTPHQRGVDIDDRPPAFGVKMLELFIII